MTELDFASRDLKRRPFRTALVLLSMVTVVTATTFLYLFANVLLDISLFVVSEGPMASLSVLFETFVWAVLLLVLILGVVVVASTVSLEMASRYRDIGLMKAVGTTVDVLFDHFTAQSVLLLVSSVVLGVASGTAIYLASLLWLAWVLPGVHFVFQFPYLQVGLLAVVYLLTGYFAAQKAIYDAVQEPPVHTLNPDVGTRVQRAGFLDGLGLSFRIAAKATGRRFHGTRRVILSLSLGIMLASVLWVGGGVVEATTHSYVERAMGRNIVAVGHPALLDRYYEAYSLYGRPLNESCSFIDDSYMVPDSLVSALATTDGVLQVDARLIDFTTVEEKRGVVWNPTLEQYELIGQERTGQALVVGVDWGSTVSDWYYEGEPINATGQVWVGGRLATTMFDDPLVQSMGVHGRALKVRAIMFDIVNNGMVAVTTRDFLQEALGTDGVNLVLVQLESYDGVLLSRIEDMAAEYGLGIYLQEEVLSQNHRVISTLWSLISPLSLMAFASAFFSLTDYLLVAVFSRLRDYVIMRSIGAKPLFIAKCIVAEGLDMGLRAAVPGILVGVVLSVLFLVPEAVIPTVWYLPVSIGLMLLAIVVVVVLAAAPVYVLFSTRSDLRVSEFQV